MPITKFMIFAQSLYQLPILYNPVQCGAKMALLLLYQRLAPLRWFQVSVWTVMFIVCGSSIAILFAATFPCTPVRAGWDISITDAKCINRQALYQWTAILGAITDILVLAVPIPIVVTLRIHWRQKAAVIAALCIGGV